MVIGAGLGSNGLHVMALHVLGYKKRVTIINYSTEKRLHLTSYFACLILK